MKKIMSLSFLFIVSILMTGCIGSNEDNNAEEKLREEQSAELDVLLKDVNKLEMRSDWRAYRVAPMDEGYTVVGQEDNEELIVSTKYKTGNVITVGLYVHHFLFNSVTEEEDDKKQFMSNILEFAGVEKDEKILLDGQHLYIGYRNQYNYQNTEGLFYGNGTVANLEVLDDHDFLILCANAIDYNNNDGKLEAALKKFLSEGKTLMIGTGAGVNDQSEYKRFMREIGVNVSNAQRPSVNTVVSDIDKEEMHDIEYINEVKRIKEIEEKNLDVEVTAAEMEELSYLYGIKGFGEEEYNELNIQFPYHYGDNEPYTRAMIYGRARTNDLSAGQNKDTSVFYDGKVDQAGDLTDTIVCDENLTTDCNEQVKKTIKMTTPSNKTVVGGGYVIPTGLYLAPGVDATIKFEVKDSAMRAQVEHSIVIDFLVSREYGGLSITEAVHQRPPGYRKTRSFGLGEFTVSSPVGGAIYLELLQDIDGLEVEVTIDGAVNMALYEKGKTTIDQFKKQLEDYNVDKVIIISDVNMISTTRLNVEQYLENGTVESSLAEFDVIYENNVDLRLGEGIRYKNTGLYERPGEGHRVWWQEDVQIKAGWMLSGYPIHTYSRYGLLNDVPHDGNERRWGEAHELGHNTQFHSVGFDNTVEVTVNINSLHQEYRRSEVFRTYSDKRDDFTTLIDFFNKGNKLPEWAVAPEDSGVEGDLGLTFYTQMAIGYYHLNGSKEGTMFDFYTEISRNEIKFDNLEGGWQQRGPKLLERHGLSDTVKLETKYEYMYVEASVLYGFDVYDMLDYYGATKNISNDVRDVIKSRFDSYKTILTSEGELLYIHEMTPSKEAGKLPEGK